MPVFNRWKFTKDCLLSLRSQTYSEFKTIVIDHGSTDGTSEHIQNEFPEVIVIKGDETMWWTAATNLGVQYAIDNKAEFILTLNNDTISRKNYIQELLNVYQLVPKNSLIGSTAIEKETNRIIFAGDIENWFWETSKFNHHDKSKLDEKFVQCSRFPGRGLLIPLFVFQKIGLYDEKDFPHYCADYEFTKRAIKNGFEVFCSIDAQIWIYPDESRANQLIRKKNITAYYNHLFGIRGAAQLHLFYKYAFRYCPWYALPSFLLLGTFRRVIGYWLK